MLTGDMVGLSKALLRLNLAHSTPLTVLTLATPSYVLVVPLAGGLVIPWSATWQGLVGPSWSLSRAWLCISWRVSCTLVGHLAGVSRP
jgi:hypothetical protein